MTEQEAIAIARQFVAEQQIEHQGVERAFFVPATSYGDMLPGKKDEWVVHFKPLPREEADFELFLSGDGTIIVSVEVETRHVSVLSTL